MHGNTNSFSRIHIRAASEIRTRDPSASAVEGRSHLTLRGHCDRFLDHNRDPKIRNVYSCNFLHFFKPAEGTTFIA